MQRFLVCLINNTDLDTEIPISYQIFPLKFATTPEEVITPERTEMFFFREEESIEKLQESLAFFKFNPECTTFVNSFSQEEPLYLYGEILETTEEDVFVLTRNLSIACIPFEAIENKAIIVVNP